MNRKQMILAIEQYYREINRVNPPKYKDYTNHELKQVILMFNIKNDL